MPDSNPLSSEKWTPELLDSMRMVQDPVADAFLDQVVEEHGHEEARRIFNLLIHNTGMDFPGAPEFVTEYFKATSALPEWADHDKMAMGQEVFADSGPTMLNLLFFKSLPTAYVCWRGAQALAMTGRMTGADENPGRFGWRVAETAQFVLNVMSKGSFAPGGRGIQAVQKIRLIHASIRKFLPPDRWNEAEWQKVINQEDMAMTVGTFSVSLVEGLAIYGANLAPERREAYIHLWQVIGHLIGLNPQLRAADFADAQSQLHIILNRQKGESEAGQMLTKALIDFAERFLNGPVLGNTPEMFMRFVIGEEYARILAVDYKPGCLSAFLPLALRKAIGMIEKLEDRSEPLEKILDALNGAVMKGLVHVVRGAKGAKMDIPSDLMAAWEIQ